MKNDVGLSRPGRVVSGGGAGNIKCPAEVIDAGKVTLQEEFSRSEMSSFSPQQMYDGSLRLRLP